MSVKQDTTRPVTIKVQSPVVIKVVWLAAFIFAVIALAATAYWIGYGVAWQKTESVYEDAIILKAKAAELEGEILHLRNALALISATLYVAGVDVPTVIDIVPDTVICSLQVPTPAQAGKE